MPCSLCLEMLINTKKERRNPLRLEGHLVSLKGRTLFSVPKESFANGRRAHGEVPRYQKQQNETISHHYFPEVENLTVVS